MAMVSVMYAGRMHRFALFDFGGKELDALHREIRCGLRWQFVVDRTYVVNHAMVGESGPWTLNMAREGYCSVHMLDLVRMADGSFALTQEVGPDGKPNAAAGGLGL